MFTLEDKYTVKNGRIFCSGLQVIVRLLLTQKYLDSQKGLKTAGFVSGYRGSPLGALDLQLWKAKKYLEASSIYFQPGINENLAASSVWGTQQIDLFKDPLYSGVFSLWYGKGPGVDQSLDALKHANYAGTSFNGGVLALAGDDHACKSSSLPHQSDQSFIAAGIPILAPSSVQEILEFGIFGWALSRYSGCWIALKLVSDIVEASATVDLDTSLQSLLEPKDENLLKKDHYLQWPDSPEKQEKRLYDIKLPAVQAFVQKNKIDKWISGSLKKKAKLGIITSGKSYYDVEQAFRALGLTPEDFEKLGIRFLKLGLVWPIDPSVIKNFSCDLDFLFIIEEKRSLIEDQIKSILYNLPNTPKILGKQTEKGRSLLSNVFELNISQIVESLLYCLKLSEITLPPTKKLSVSSDNFKTSLERLPFYCSGCPHNTSTTSLPTGSKALAGIGCHYMAMWITDMTQTSTHMGAEGTPWIGISPFCKEKHVFANIGDGTYYHSGILAIRASIAAGVNITYKILFNDAVAMTGGQEVDGKLSVPQISHQMFAEGVKTIAVVTDDVYKFPIGTDFAKGTTLYPKSDLSLVQQQLKETPGTTVLIYDQTCAAENRRRRKRGLSYDPPKRVFINKEVCEGCGDCSKSSNCLSVIPIETEFGTKREIDQSTCNKDYSCIDGFCPSFVTVVGKEKKESNILPSQEKWISDHVKELPRPSLQSVEHHPHITLIAGVGGTGMVTIASMLGTAAHIENKFCTIMDQTGLAQKGGSVYSHIKIASRKDLLHTYKISPKETDLLLACDALTAHQKFAKETLKPKETSIIANQHKLMHPNFIKDSNFKFQQEPIFEDFSKIVGQENIYVLEAQKIAEKVLGNTIYMNLLILGFACQKNKLPVKAESILKTIRLNNIEVEKNILAFNLGRLCAYDIKKVINYFSSNEKEKKPLKNLEDIIKYRIDHLTLYQNSDYAKKYEKKLNIFKSLENTLGLKKGTLVKPIAKNYHKLLAYKDEYEVARLFTESNFLKNVKKPFEKGSKVYFYLAPPFLSSLKEDGKPKKRKYSSWIIYVFRIIAKLKFLRGTFLDPFGYTKDRLLEKKILKKYEDILYQVEKNVPFKNLEVVIQLLSWPEKISGFGYVKEKAALKVLNSLEELEKTSF